MNCPNCCGSGRAKTQARFDCLYCQPYNGSGVISAAWFLRNIREMRLSDYSVEGGFVCYDHRLREKLISDVNTLRRCLHAGGKPLSVLLCAGPGGGKTFFVQQVAATCGAEFVEDNLSRSTNLKANLDEHIVRIVEKLSKHSKVVAFLDEVDTVVSGETSYRFLLQAVDGSEINIGKKAVLLTNLLWFFAASKATSRSEFKIALADNQYEKGEDFLSRCHFTITLPSVNSPGQRIVQAAAMAKAEHHNLERIEASVLFYYACRAFQSAREMKTHVRAVVSSLALGARILELGHVGESQEIVDFLRCYSSQLDGLIGRRLRIS